MASPTKDQLSCIEHVSGPLLVSAGAGSGKTFMLTQRIAYALLHPEVSGVRDIDQVLAITFTNLAASEIKGRVRGKLREEGLFDQALKVDASWISTIHGMCQRILREHAVDLGLDPGFELMEGNDAVDCLDAAVNAALGECAEHDADGRFRRLFGLFPNSGFNTQSAFDLVKEVISQAAGIVGGIDAFKFGKPMAPHDVARAVFDAMQECDAVARTGIGTNGKAKETFTTKARDVLEDPELGMPAYERLLAKRDCSFDDLAPLMSRLDLSFGSRTKKEPFREGYTRFRLEFEKMGEEVALGLLEPSHDAVIELARRATAIYEDEKRSRGVLDTDDLITKTLEAFETCPDVAAEYRERFKLVMVDEFQDTSALQIALIGHLTQGDSVLCTVGDTQQSIYRFRGADVATYAGHKRHMRELEPIGGLCKELDVNFRSHGDIIAFVNRLFAQQEVFGASGEFIELGWDKNHAASNPFPDVERIDVAVTRGADTTTRLLVEAEQIARRFEALHDDGAANQSWGDMVILLGKTTHADAYADTLRAHGIPCVIAGGSTFSSTQEVLEVRALLAAVANPLDDDSMREALAGGAFNLDSEDLLALSTTPRGRQRGYWAGLCADDVDAPQVRLAASVIRNAVARVRTAAPSEVLRDAAVESGWLERLQAEGAQGMAKAANVLKAVRIVADQERDGGHDGAFWVSEQFTRLLDGNLKENPGTLNSRAQNAVRIMTIHASKGLEFPIVALAQFDAGSPRSRSQFAETIAGTTYYALVPSESKLATSTGVACEKLPCKGVSETIRKRLPEYGLEEEVLDDPCEADTARDYVESVKAKAADEELGELRRKFYVGATRPREALIVAVNVGAEKEREDGSFYGDVVRDLDRCLYGHDARFATAPNGIDFGGTKPARVSVVDIEGEKGALTIGGDPLEGWLSPTMAQLVAGCADEDAGGDGEKVIKDAGETTAGDARENLGEKTAEVAGGTDGDAAEESLGVGEPRGVGEPQGVGESQEAGEPQEIMIPTAPGAEDHLARMVTRPVEFRGTHGNTVSYTSLAAKADEEAQAALQKESPSDRKRTGVVRHRDSAAFGSAFHQACQWMADELSSREPGDQTAGWTVPDTPVLDRIAARWGVEEDEVGELAEAVRRWAGSDVARKAASFPCVQGEAPFFVKYLGRQGEPVYLEGSIDLLCRDPHNPGRAFVVDYKTGGSSDETRAELKEKHLAQARCYAYALMEGGCTDVELAFVRVEQPTGADGEPQTVLYSFDASDRQSLEEAIRTM